MNDMKCPYCGAEWEHDKKDYTYGKQIEEYECPVCGRIFIMTTEYVLDFFGETAESYYKRKIACEKEYVELYTKMMNYHIEKNQKETAEDCKIMRDSYYLPRLKTAEKALERCIEHNRKVGEEDENNKNDCKNL